MGGSGGRCQLTADESVGPTGAREGDRREGVEKRDTVKYRRYWGGMSER